MALIFLIFFIASMGQHSLANGPRCEPALDPPLLRRLAEVYQPGSPHQVYFSTNGSAHPDELGRLHYRSETYVGLTAALDPTLNSVRYFPRVGRFPEGARAFLSLIHGIGAEYSHAGSMFRPLQLLTRRKEQIQKEIQKRLGDDFIPVAAEAFDLPFSGFGPRNDRRYETLDGTLGVLDNYYGLVSAETSLPIVPIARSSGPPLILELNARFARLGGMVLIGPLHARPELGLSENIAQHQRMVGAGEIEENQAAFNWFTPMLDEMTWPDLNDPFRGTPTLILVGQYDRETPLTTRNWFHRQALRHPHVTYWEVPNAFHDVLAPRRAFKHPELGELPPYNPRPIYLAIQRFLREILDTPPED